MISYLDKLNLKPFEKRLVVFFIIVIFVLINFLFVWPHFGDWKKQQVQRKEAKQKLADYNEEISRMETYKQLLDGLKGGGNVATEDQAVQVMRSVQNQARESGVLITSQGRQNTQTNGTFLEQRATINVQSDEEQLVDFLYKLGSGDLGIRVRDLGLRPDQKRYKLGGSITVVASFQRNVPARSRNTSSGARRSPSPAAPDRSARAGK